MTQHIKLEVDDDPFSYFAAVVRGDVDAARQSAERGERVYLSEP